MLIKIKCLRKNKTQIDHVLGARKHQIVQECEHTGTSINVFKQR